MGWGGRLARRAVLSLLHPVLSSGEDPLVEGCSACDLDSVAGVLKLYFRSLEPPLFPPNLFRELLASAGEARARGRRGGKGRSPVVCGRTHGLLSSRGGGPVTELEAMEERVELVSRLLTQLPGPVLVVLRYLFTFLSQ